MIATFALARVLPVLLLCCGVVVVFALAFRRRPLIGGVGAAIMVLFMLVAALFVARSANVAAVWPRAATWSQTHIIPKPSIPSDVSGLSQELAFLEEDVSPLVEEEPALVEGILENEHIAKAREIQRARCSLREAREEALVKRRAMKSSRETALLALTERSHVPPVAVEVRHAPKPREGFMRRVLGGGWHRTSFGTPRCILSSLLTAVVIASFLGVGYVFLDASTRGQFTWPLRIVAVVAFAAIYVAMSALR